MLIKIYKPLSHKEFMKLIKMCAMLMLVLLSFSFAQAAVSNTDGSSIIVTPVPTTPDTTIVDAQNTNPEENSSNLSTSSKILVVVVPIFIIFLGLYLLKKRRRKKMREFDAQPKDIDQERLWKDAIKVKQSGDKNPREVVIVDEGKKPEPLSENEEMVRRTTKKVLTDPKKATEDEKEKARLAIEEILEDAKLRDKPGFDDPTQGVTTYK